MKPQNLPAGRQGTCPTFVGRSRLQPAKAEGVLWAARSDPRCELFAHRDLFNDIIKHMEINQKIFKAYDIRGIYPGDLNEEIAYRIGRAFVSFLRKFNTKAEKLKIVVGQDNRLSSPSLSKALINGITDQGADVIDIGLSVTPIMYFAVAYYKFDGGINVTASHNPKDYNGFKLVREEATPVAEQSGMNEVKEMVKVNYFEAGPKGKIVEKYVIGDYFDFILKDFNLKYFESFRLVFDTANAVSGIVVSKLVERIGFSVKHLFSDLDGSFPNHQPDPLSKENLTDIQREVVAEKADIGVAFDGDGDRMFLVSEKGEVVPADIVGALISKMILEESDNSEKPIKIYYDVRCGRILPETIKKFGGEPIIGKVGHSLIKEKMRSEDILFAIELSGHFYYKAHYLCESPVFVLLKVLQEMKKTNKTFSQLVEPLHKYYSSGEINFSVIDKDGIIRQLEEKLGRGGEVLKIDGIRVDFDDWWFGVRPSNTEPLLRLVLEAKTKELMEEKKAEIIKIIQNN